VTEELGSYPHRLAGQDCGPPGTPSARVLAMAGEAQRRTTPPLDDGPLYGAGQWRMAASLVVLGDEANHANPRRDKASDGTIGDARHQALGEASDHNPWLVHRGIGVCRARDVDASHLPMAAAVERARRAAYRNERHPLRGGGYIIYAGKITRPDFSGWKVYTGSNPHVLMAHFSVSTDPARFDSREPWGIFTDTPAAPPAPPAKRPTPARPSSSGWDGPDLRGTGLNLRGEQGNNGPRVRAWQQFLNRAYPAYADLEVDGHWGPATSRVNREFAHRSGIRSADGRNIGPQLARAYHRAGLFRTLSGAQAKVLGHVARPGRR
jgi:hypothetical protein